MRRMHYSNLLSTDRESKVREEGHVYPTLAIESCVVISLSRPMLRIPHYWEL